jgi:hypothetical protein
MPLEDLHAKKDRQLTRIIHRFEFSVALGAIFG